MQILTNNNRKFEKPSRNPSYRTKVKILRKKIFWIAHQKILVPRMLSHRENVRTSKFWQKSKEKNRNFFRKLAKDIEKKFKIILCLCTLSNLGCKLVYTLTYVTYRFDLQRHRKDTIFCTYI
jgi:hypothetical protein